MKRAVYAFILLLFSIMSTANAQIKLKGRVVDENYQHPISGANIRLLKTNYGCETNSNGEFVMDNIPIKESIMRISAQGYEIIEIPISSSNLDLHIILKKLPININQVVVTGTGTHRRLKDSPVQIEVVGSREIRNAGITTLQDAVTMLAPSFSFSETPMSSYTSMNGFSNEHILILVDGEKLAGNISGSTDISRVNMSRVKRIEILKGAASSLYGSDAVGGVINIITEQPKNSVNVSSFTRYEEYDQFNEALNVDFAGQKFKSYTSYNRMQSGGWQLNDMAVTIKKDKPGKPYKTVRQASTKYLQNVVSQRFVVNPTSRLSLYANAGFYNKATDRPSTELDKTGYEYNVLTQSFNLGAGAKYLLKKSDFIEFSFYNDNFKHENKYIVDTKKNIKNSKELNQNQHYYSTNIKGSFKLGKMNKLSSGVEHIYDKLENPSALLEKKDVYTASVFAQDEFKYDKFQAVGGLRYVYHKKFGSKITPQVSLMFSPDKFNLRASFACGFRAPSLKELYYIKEKDNTISIGNENLKPENSRFFSLNAEYVHKFFTISATAYVNDLENMISLQQVEDISMIAGYDPKYSYKMYKNVGKANVKGIDITLKTYLGAGFAIGGGYSYVYGRDKETDKPLPRSVNHIGSVNANWNHTWNKYDLNVNIVSHIQSSRYETAQERAPGYSLWNLTIRNRFNCFKNFIIEPSFGIDNLFNYKDDRYYGYYYSTLSPGRTIFVSLLLKFYK